MSNNIYINNLKIEYNSLMEASNALKKKIDGMVADGANSAECLLYTRTLRSMKKYAEDIKSIILYEEKK